MQESLYDLKTIEKVVLLVEEYPWPEGHAGVVFEDLEGNTLGYHFGPWDGAGKSRLLKERPGRIIKETFAYHRYERHGGIGFILNLDMLGRWRYKSFCEELMKKGISLAGPNHVYGNIVQMVECDTGKWEKYHIWRNNCVRFAIEGLLYAFQGMPQEKAIRNLSQGAFWARTGPAGLADWLKKEGMTERVIKDWMTLKK